MWSRSDYEAAFEVLQNLDVAYREIEKAISPNDQDRLDRALRQAYSKIYHYMEPERILQLIAEITDILEKYARRN